MTSTKGIKIIDNDIIRTVINNFGRRIVGHNLVCK